MVLRLLAFDGYGAQGKCRGLRCEGMWARGVRGIGGVSINYLGRVFIILGGFFFASLGGSEERLVEGERNPFAMTKQLMKALTKVPEQQAQGLFSSSNGASLINGLPHIRLQAVSFGNKKRNAVLEKKDGSTLFVSEGDQLYLIENGQYVAMNVLEIKPRSILIQLGNDETIIEVQ